MSLPSFVAAEASLRSEILARLKVGLDLPESGALGVTIDQLRACAEGKESTSAAVGLVARFMRPVLPMAGRAQVTADAAFWQRRLAIAGRELASTARAVAVVDLEGHPGASWAGSCALVSPGVAVTTRAVASRFCTATGGKLSIGGQGFPVRATARFDGRAPVGIKSVVMVEGAGVVSQLAFLKLDTAVTDRAPVDLAEVPPAAGGLVAAIGFAAADSRAPFAPVPMLPREGVNRKCVAPGRIRSFKARASLLHDCATADDWGGAVLFDLGTGQVAGIHAGGALDRPGFGIAAVDVRDAMKRLRIPIPAPQERKGLEYGDEGLERRRPTAEDYADREGYDEDFIGTRVPPPKPAAGIKKDVLAVDGAKGKRTTLLAYTHFSVCMSKSRRMCFFTACNVHGGKLLDLPRSGIPWLFDPRIDEDEQAGNDLYLDNDLDRGHMVRRLDPVWGDDADEANRDTFHYTNSCPQHKDLNQKIWNDLEEYILSNAGKHELKVNVFTGPVFRDDDMEYRGFQVPAEFWKVVAIVKDDGALSVTAYILSQVDMIEGLEFAYGRFRTYQIRVRDVEKMTKLDFGKLRDHDPKDALEAAAGPTEIEGPGDIVI